MKYHWLYLVILCSMAVGCMADTHTWKQGDARLEKKISIDADHTKLVDVLKTLTDQTGVVLTAGSSKRDWRVIERHLTVRAKDVPLGSFMAGLSQLVNYRISRGGKEGQWSYLFWQDKKAKDIEEAMLEADRDAEKNAIHQAQLDAIDTAKKALSMSPEEAMKKADSDPWLAYLGGTKSGRGTAQLMSTYGDRFLHSIEELCANMDLIHVLFSDMSPRLRSAAIDSIQGSIGITRRKQYGQNSDFTLTGVEFIPQTPNGSLNMHTDGFGGLIILDGTFGNSNKGDALAIPFVSSDSIMGAKWGRQALELQNGANPDEAEKKGELEGDKLTNILKAAQESPTEKNPPKDPKLTREVVLGELPAPKILYDNISYSSGDTAKAVSAISKTIGLPFEMESFQHTIPIGLFMKPGKQPLYKILIGLEKAGYTWNIDDDILRVRPLNWATHRSYEISEDFINYYKSILDLQGEFTVDDIAGIVTNLTDAQIKNTLQADQDISYAIHFDVESARAFLEFYSTLRLNNKAALVSDAGLGFGQLTPVQWDKLNEVVGRSGDAGYIIDGVIRLSQDPGKSPFDDLGTKKVSFDIAIQIEGQDDLQYRRSTVLLMKKDHIARRKAELLKERKADADQLAESSTPVKTE
ncbi:MAG: hypothetical protein ACYC27_10635 [Armatimonadota bacterium]